MKVRLASVVVVVAGMAGCAPIPPPRAVTDAEATARSKAVADARGVAPAAVARADGLLDEARHAQEDDVYARAQFLAERASAAYAEAIATARLVRANARAEAGTKEAAALEDELARAEGDQARLAAEVERLKAELSVLAEAERPRSSGPTSPERERARARTARAYVTEARIFCATARMTRADGSPRAIVEEIDESEKLLSDIESRLGGGSAPIDGAARVRAACLDVLTRTRREAKAAADGSILLLDALSGFAAAEGGMSVERDPRGVVVRLDRPFEADGLSVRARKQLRALDEVLAQNPGFGVTVVSHAGEAVADTRAPTRKALLDEILAVFAHAPPSRKLAFDARNFLPLVDPEGKDRKTNARLEIVFFAAPSSP